MDEIVEMNNAVVDFCNSSGCSLLELFYGLNDATEAEMRYLSQAHVIEFYNEWLERLAENEDPEQDEQIEQQFVDLLTKKIEKILAIHKPETFYNDVLAKVNLQQASLEVEQNTHGLSKLLHLRIQDHIVSRIQD